MRVRLLHCLFEWTHFPHPVHSTDPWLADLPQVLQGQRMGGPGLGSMPAIRSRRPSRVAGISCSAGEKVQCGM